MSDRTTDHKLSIPLRFAVAITALIDFVLGLAFLFGTELGLNLWPTPVSIELTRFIGSIILGNGVGAAMIVRQGTWEGARVLFTVALIYGIVVFATLLYDLVRGAANPLFWGYITADAIFLLPIVYIYWSHELTRK